MKGGFEKKEKFLDETECCALAHAFAKNTDTLKKISQIEGEEEFHVLKLLADMLATSSNLDFSEKLKIDYNALALISQAELERLAQKKTAQEADFLCPHQNHSIQDHQKALHNVIKKFGSTIN